jgi:predicted ester cyclase
MNVETNIQLLRRAWAAWDRGDEEGFASCLTDDWREHEGNESGTLDDERRAMRLHRIAFPDKHTEIHRIVADEVTVACYCTTSATHTGRYVDAEPTGKRVAINEMIFNRVQDGCLAETWVITEGPRFYEQITGHRAPANPDSLG